MSNVDVSIFGSTIFSSILRELEFNKILNFNNQLNFKDKKIIVKILFVETLKVKEVKN